MVHSHLRQAIYPVAVGHYYRDVIVNAEAALDAALDGALRRRFDLGVYPGEVGTSEIFLHGLHPPGAIVIGLGPVGDLTSERLRLVFAKALRRFALAVLENETSESESKSRSAAFSALLVGTDGGALGGISDSIHAIVRGAIAANRSLAETGLADRVFIDKIEFVELYEDVAIQAAHIVDDLPRTLAQELKAGEHIELCPVSPHETWRRLSAALQSIRCRLVATDRCSQKNRRRGRHGHDIGFHHGIAVHSSNRPGPAGAGGCRGPAGSHSATVDKHD